MSLFGHVEKSAAYVEEPPRERLHRELAYWRRHARFALAAVAGLMLIVTFGAVVMLPPASVFLAAMTSVTALLLAYRVYGGGIRS